MYDTPSTVKDKDWVNSAFMVTGDDLEKIDLQNRFFSTTSMKFHDTTPGGGFCINPPPQFTRSADVKADNLFLRDKDGDQIDVGDISLADQSVPFAINPNARLGRYYGEAIDDNSQLISMRFGVAKFNSMTNFFTNFYSAAAGRTARTGRLNNLLYTVGRGVGLVMQIYAPPLMYLQVANFMGQGIRFMMGKPSTKYYYLKPAMPMYWNAVQSMVNHLAVLKGIAPRAGDDEVQRSLNIGLSAADRQYYAQVLPDIFDDTGSINVYGLATRGQRKYRKYRKMVEEHLDRSYDGLNSVQEAIHSFTTTPITDNSRGRPTLAAYIKRWMDNSEGRPVYSGGNENGKESEAVEAVPNYEPGKVPEDGFYEFFKSELDDGSAFVTFRVNYTGSVQESFSNSVGESEISSKLNGISSSARSTSFSMAEGNIAGIMTGIVDGFKDFTAGLADQLGVSGLVSLAGAAFVDIPKHWQSSASSLPRSTYSIDLVSPYGNRLSRFLNIDIPLAMLLAGTLPLSTGKQSYSSPFLCEIYDQGRCQTRLGMIDSLSITRGSGNMGFNNSGQTMAVKVSFSVVDMTSIVHMPIIEGFSLNPADAFFDEDTAFSDYMASLAGLGLADQIYPWKKLKINFSKQREHWKSFISEQHLANYLGGTTPALLLSAFFKGTPR